jgi:hypothetical protein
MLKQWMAAVIDDVFLLAGCACILYGLALWSVILTWIVAGLMLIIAGVLIGKVKAKHAAE